MNSFLKIKLIYFLFFKEYANHSNANYAIENINGKLSFDYKIILELMYNGTKLTAEFAKEPKSIIIMDLISQQVIRLISLSTQEFI